MNGFMWCDFLPRKGHISFQPGRGFALGEQITNKILDSYIDKGRIQVVFRGHQHAIGKVMKEKKYIFNQFVKQLDWTIVGFN